MEENRTFSAPVVTNTEPEENIPKEVQQQIHDEFIEDRTIPVSQYEKVRKVPYAVRYFNYEDFVGLNEITDFNDFRGKLKFIDKYVVDEIYNRNLEDTVESYEQIMKELEEYSFSKENENAGFRIMKVVNYIKQAEKYRKMQERKDLLRTSLYGSDR